MHIIVRVDALMNLPTCVLQKNITAHIRQGHPWIYRDAVRPLRGIAPSMGQVVRVEEHTGAFVAYGIWDSVSPLAIRICSLMPEQVPDVAWQQQQLRNALKRRLSWLQPEQTNAFRWCHGESDHTPGLVVDVYHDTAVVQYDGAGPEFFWSAHMPSFLDDHADLWPLARVYWKRRRQSGVLLRGTLPPEEIPIREHGVHFGVNIQQGQKTGFFLDQRDNRDRLRRYVTNKRVWNGFAYTGGFSVYAALSGARYVASVDIAAAALETAQRNFVRNGLSPESHGFFTQDVFVHLRQALLAKEQYDVVVVDPPSFAHAEASVPQALRSYQELYALALQLLPVGGYLAAGSCSSHISTEDFLQMLSAAAYQARSVLQILEVHGQPPDHPSLLHAPETRYLKFAICERIS